jgi:mannose/cellobiose epimerase-like protein (N-acyl-D-glucosamine 2-epimerase family)
MMTGDERYLTYAQYALDFLYDHGWDKTKAASGEERGGWYCFGNKNGSIKTTPWAPDLSEKWSFQQHYGMLGPIAHYEVTQDERSKEFVNKGMQSLYDNLWDPRPGYEGYYSNADLDWKNPRNKGFTPTVDAITTHAELIYLVTQEEEHKNRLMQLGDNIVDHFISWMDDNPSKILYPGEYDSNWNTTGGSSSIGHFVKTAWCLGRIYLCDTGEEKYKEGAIKILDKTWTYQKGNTSLWDRENGGLFESISMDGVQPEKRKDYWTVEQGFTGSMINYYITQNKTYLEMADRSLDFFMNHFVDEEYGGTFWTLEADGTLLNDQKGDNYEGNYHACELGYYAYLYSNLYYLYQPANLYYMFEKKDEARNIQLTPIPMEDGLLRIKSVTLDGRDFTSFDPVSRTLNIAANEGGKFKVTFQSYETHPSSVNDFAATSVNIYPNPAADYIRVSGDFPIQAIVLSDLSGRVLDKKACNLEYSCDIELSRILSGVYFITVMYEKGSITKKVVKRG